MRKRYLSPLFVGAASFLSLAAHADSTTGVIVTLGGKPVPGKQLSATVQVTGKHLVYGPRHSVNGGNVQLMLNGTLVAQVPASLANSDVYDSGCVDSGCGLYIYRSRNTTVTFPITLPKGVSSYQFTGTYTGDKDSNSSTSPAVTVTPVFEGASAAISLLLD